MNKSRNQIMFSKLYSATEIVSHAMKPRKKLVPNEKGGNTSRLA